MSTNKIRGRRIKFPKNFFFCPRPGQRAYSFNKFKAIEGYFPQTRVCVGGQDVDQLLLKKKFPTLFKFNK